MKKKWFHAENDPLYHSLLLVVALFLVSVLAACFSFLIVGERKKGLDTEAWKIMYQDSAVEKAEIVEGKETIDIENLKVGEITGEVIQIEENKIVFKAMVYGEKEENFAIALDEEEKKRIIKYVSLETKDKHGLPEVQKQTIDFEKLETGDLITFRFPLEVPVSEVKSGSLLIEEIIVDNEYDASKSLE